MSIQVPGFYNMQECCNVNEWFTHAYLPLILNASNTKDVLSLPYILELIIYVLDKKSTLWHLFPLTRSAFKQKWCFLFPSFCGTCERQGLTLQLRLTQNLPFTCLRALSADIRTSTASLKPYSSKCLSFKNHWIVSYITFSSLISKSSLKSTQSQFSSFWKSSF